LAEDVFVLAFVREVQQLVTEGLDEVSDLVLIDSRCLVLAEVPDGLHHAHEVLIAGNAHAQISVVVAPLALGDLAVFVTLDALKTVEEIFKDFLARLCAINEVLVAAHIEDLFDILDAHNARSIPVN